MAYPDITQVVQVKSVYDNSLLKLKNVVACGVGYKETDEGVTDKPAVVVSVSRKLPEAQLAATDLVPKEIGGVATDVVETGEFMAMLAASDTDPRRKWAPPVPPGVSIGHTKVTAGTLGCLVRRGDAVYILSNNHVLANLNKASIGDQIIQPGRHDGGTKDDVIATLADFVALDFGGEESRCDFASSTAKVLNFAAQATGSSHRLIPILETSGMNKVDAAIALPTDASTVSSEILHIGTPKGHKNATLGMNVRKSGRTTGYTEGRIIQIEVTTQVTYGGQTVHFQGQLMASAMSGAGDSGSAVLDGEGNVVGLLFAGSDVATLINPIGLVLQALNVEIVT